MSYKRVFAMADDEIRIKSIDDLQGAQSAYAANGASVPNYNDWNNLLADFEEKGIESTGSYAGDLALHNTLRAEPVGSPDDVQKTSEIEANKIQDERVNATENITKLTDSDSDQALKANFANGTSSAIAANQMLAFIQMYS